MKLKNNKKKRISFYLSTELIIIVLGIFLAIWGVNRCAKRINDVVLPIAMAETRKYITVLINGATKGVMFDKNLFVIDKEKEEIKMISYDTYEATKLINEIISNIQNSLNDRDKYYNSVVTEIPLGIIFNNGLIKNIGPRIKVRVDSINDIIGQLETEVKPYGINNALVEVKVHIEANAVVILPLTSNEIKISNTIPISVNIISGNIPEAYFMTYK